MCRGRATYLWKVLETSIESKVYQKNYRHPKWWESQFRKFQNFWPGSLEKNDIWVQPLWLVIENNIRGKFVISPKFGLWWILWVHACLLWVRAPKMSNYALTNLLFDLCRSIWIIDLLVTCPSPHFKIPTCPYYPWSVVN